MPDNEYFEKYLEQRFTNVDLKLDALQQSMNSFRQDVDRRFEEVDRRFEEVNRRFGDVNHRFDEMAANSNHQFEDLAARINTLQNVGWSIILTSVGVLASVIALLVKG